MMERLKVRIGMIAELTDRIRAYELRPVTRGDSLPPFTAGSHVTLYLPSGTERQYSIFNDPQETHRYCIGVQREDQGRGGSLEVHSGLQVGDEIEISTPKNNFPMSDLSQSCVLIAGGIGITPIMSMARRLSRIGQPFRLLYLARNGRDAAFLDILDVMADESREIIRHFDEGDPGKLFDLKGFLADQREGAHLYCCGPEGLMNAVHNLSTHWVEGSVHFEYFSNSDAGPTADDTAFSVSIPRLKKTVTVAAGQTIVQALEAAGIDVDYSCLEGTCGTCIVPLLEGQADHRDKVLMEHELDNSIAICCSRARTKSITIDL